MANRVLLRGAHTSVAFRFVNDFPRTRAPLLCNHTPSAIRPTQQSEQRNARCRSSLSSGPEARDSGARGEMAAGRNALARLTAEHSALFVCDIQERFRPTIHNMPAVIDTASKMLRCARELQMPVIVTEQYPKALGSTVEELAKDLPEDTTAVAKTVFSMIVPEVEEQLKRLPDVKQVVLVGIEAHVCVTATTLDLIEKGYEVHLLTDGISSRTAEDRAVGLQRMMQAGALVTSFEMAAFQLMGHAKHPVFKAVSALAKEERPQQLPKL